MVWRTPARYEPLVLSVSRTGQGYISVTLSLWPGGELSVTLTERGLTEAQARAAALELAPNIMTLIGG